MDPFLASFSCHIPPTWQWAPSKLKWTSSKGEGQGRYRAFIIWHFLLPVDKYLVLCLGDTSGNSEFWNLEPQLWQFRKLNETLWDKIQTTFYVENFLSLIFTKSYVISTSINLEDVSQILNNFCGTFSEKLLLQLFSLML